MISSTQLANLRQRATEQIEEVFPTTISIGAHANLPAARWSQGGSAGSELAGLLATYDLAIRVRLDVLTGIPVIPERTTIIEDGKTYRVERIRSAKGDPAIILECKAA